jgi:hypothetical protein
LELLSSTASCLFHITRQSSIACLAASFFRESALMQTKHGRSSSTRCIACPDQHDAPVSGRDLHLLQRLNHSFGQLAARLLYACPSYKLHAFSFDDVGRTGAEDNASTSRSAHEHVQRFRQGTRHGFVNLASMA